VAMQMGTGLDHNLVNKLRWYVCMQRVPYEMKHMYLNG
jgi:hypothetical protein